MLLHFQGAGSLLKDLQQRAAGRAAGGGAGQVRAAGPRAGDGAAPTAAAGAAAAASGRAAWMLHSYQLAGSAMAQLMAAHTAMTARQREAGPGAGLQPSQEGECRVLGAGPERMHTKDVAHGLK